MATKTYFVEASDKISKENQNEILEYKIIQADSLQQALAYAKALAYMIVTLTQDISETLEIKIMYACDEAKVQYDSDSISENVIRNQIFEDDLIYNAYELNTETLLTDPDLICIGSGIIGEPENIKKHIIKENQ